MTSPQPERRHRLTPTASQTVGPFFHFAMGTDPALGTLVAEGTKGERIRLVVRVFDGDAEPISDALIEIYQADADGHYPVDRAAHAGFSGFGRLATDIDGTCVFETIRPGLVEDEGGRAQARHINVCLFARGLLHELYTRIYFAGDPGLASDPLLGCVPEDRRRTLIASPEAATGTWRFDIHLQGEHETVFFAP